MNISLTKWNSQSVLLHTCIRTISIIRLLALSFVLAFSFYFSHKEFISFCYWFTVPPNEMIHLHAWIHWVDKYAFLLFDWWKQIVSFDAIVANNLWFDIDKNANLKLITLCVELSYGEDNEMQQKMGIMVQWLKLYNTHTHSFTQILSNKIDHIQLHKKQHDTLKMT